MILMVREFCVGVLRVDRRADAMNGDEVFEAQAVLREGGYRNKKRDDKRKFSHRMYPNDFRFS